MTKRWFWMRVMKPRLEFGAPVDRTEKERESWWHVPVKIERCWYRSSELKECRVVIEDDAGAAIPVRLTGRWGDMFTDEPQDRVNLREGEVVLVPVVWRSEEGEDRGAYLTEKEFFEGRKKWRIAPDRKKRRIKLVVESGPYRAKSRTSYLIRVPNISSNGQFSLEAEYKGGGTTPVPLEHAKHGTRKASKPGRSPKKELERAIFGVQ